MDYDIARELERTRQGMEADKMVTEMEKNHMARELMQADIREMLANEELNQPVKIKRSCGERFRKLIDRIKTVFGW